jgi:hypothetical protein
MTEPEIYHSLIKCYLSDESIFTSIGISNPIRKILNQRYRREIMDKTIQPIENCEHKKDYWEEALKWPLGREQRKELAIGLYYLASVAHRYQSS